MSFDDVARRMQEREGTAPGRTSTPVSADRFVAEMQAADRRARGRNDIVYGAILLAIGLGITLVTYDSASRSGGTYIIAYGPMIVGAIRLFRGLAS